MIYQKSLLSLEYQKILILTCKNTSYIMFFANNCGYVINSQHASSQICSQLKSISSSQSLYWVCILLK